MAAYGDSGRLSRGGFVGRIVTRERPGKLRSQGACNPITRCSSVQLVLVSWNEIAVGRLLKEQMVAMR